ncbi:coenzyme F420-0:L-glutamate ligase [Pseudomonadota bacterium]
MLIKGLKSKIITQEDDLLKVVLDTLKKQPLKDGDVLVITSKVVALTQGKIVEIKSEKEFEKVVKREADRVYGGKVATLTLKDGIFIPWAGVDRSNIQKGKAVLWPDNPYKVAADLQKTLKKKFGLKKLGIIISDSICAPLRKGVTAVALGYAGFKGVEDERASKDLFGNKLKVTQKAVADMLAVAVNLEMGEGNEATPFVIVREAPVTFTNRAAKSGDLLIDRKDCLFNPLYSKK